MNSEEQYANLELGKTYDFMGYKWTACELINNGKTLVIQSHGVTCGTWPGFKMPHFGNGECYEKNVDGEDIHDYDEAMQRLYASIKDVEATSAVYGAGLYLLYKEKASVEPFLSALKEAAENFNSFMACDNLAWTGTLDGDYGAWYVHSNGSVYHCSQDSDYVIAPAFNLDPSKVEVVGDEIVKKAQPTPSSFEHDDNCQEHQFLGKTYDFMGYKWTACELINNGKTLVIQSHGVTHGAWPGFVMPQFGNGHFYSKSIAGEDISGYDDKMQALYDGIKGVEDKSAPYGKGLYLVSKEKAGYVEFERTGSGNYWKVLQGVSMNYSPFGATCFSTWLGTVADANGGNAFSMDIGGCIGYSICNQPNEYAIAPAFNLDLSKVEIRGDKIVKKTQPTLSSEHDDNCLEHPHLGKTYNFMGYKWTACELVNNGNCVVIQSHGVTQGVWPGYKMLKFGGKVDAFYATDIDGEDISVYDDKMQALYEAIKDVEDKSALYGKGLFLVSAEKAQLPTVIYGASGAGYYCDALVSAGSEGNPNGTHCNAWLGTLGNKENTAWFVNGFANGYISLQDDVVKTIAPAFNLDLSKVVISGDEIVKKTQSDTTNGFDFASMAVATPSDNNLSANNNHNSMSAADAKNLFKNFAKRLPSDTTLADQVTSNPMIARIKCSKYSAQIANTLNMHFAASNSLYSALSSECSISSEILLMLQERSCETHYLGNVLLAFIPENVSFPEIDCLYNLPKNSFFTNITVDRLAGEVVIEYNSANNGDAEFFRSLFAVCQGTIKHINIVPRDTNTDLFDKNYNFCGIHIDSVTDDSAVENRKAQFIIAEQGIAELAGAVAAQSDSSKELTDDDRLVELCKEASQRAASDDSYVPNLVLQICKRFNWNVNERYDDVEEILSQIVSTGLQITSETVSKSDIFERMFCLLTNLNFTDFIHNYIGQPASADSPKKMDL